MAEFWRSNNKSQRKVFSGKFTHDTLLWLYSIKTVNNGNKWTIVRVSAKKNCYIISSRFMSLKLHTMVYCVMDEPVCKLSSHLSLRSHGCQISGEKIRIFQLQTSEIPTRRQGMLEIKTRTIHRKNRKNRKNNIWSITFISARGRPWNLKCPISRNCELDFYVRKSQNVFFHWHRFRLVVASLEMPIFRVCRKNTTFTQTRTTDIWTFSKKQLSPRYTVTYQSKLLFFLQMSKNVLLD